MKTSAEGFRQCYNAQVAVDGEHPWIVATELTSNASDQGAMAGLLDEVEETFDAQPERVLAEITRIGGLVGLSGPFRVPCLPLRTCGVPAFVLIPASSPARPSAHVLEHPFYGADSWTVGWTVACRALTARSIAEAIRRSSPSRSRSIRRSRVSSGGTRRSAAAISQARA